MPIEYIGIPIPMQSAIRRRVRGSELRRMNRASAVTDIVANNTTRIRRDGFVFAIEERGMARKRNIRNAWRKSSEKTDGGRGGS